MALANENVFLFHTCVAISLFKIIFVKVKLDDEVKVMVVAKSLKRRSVQPASAVMSTVKFAFMPAGVTVALKPHSVAIVR